MVGISFENIQVYLQDMDYAYVFIILAVTLCTVKCQMLFSFKNKQVQCIITGVIWNANLIRWCNCLKLVLFYNEERLEECS